MKLYGSLTNRLEEGRQYCDEIVVGTGVTEYHWSDRDAYEVVAVRDQKHVTVRELDHRHVGDGVMDNNWELVSNENNPTRELERRGDVWYWSSTLTADDIAGIDDDMNGKIRVVLAGFDIDKIREKGKQTKRRKANVSIGVAEYYYDYEF
ncbi:MAG: hypothetical protein IJM76_05780 [Lachnospiraceae bacterium]|nr:hypothetical protein [Lachnospiraceae bacterium]